MLNNFCDWKQFLGLVFVFCFVKVWVMSEPAVPAEWLNSTLWEDSLSTDHLLLHHTIREMWEVPDVADRCSDWHGRIHTTIKFTDTDAGTYCPPTSPAPPPPSLPTLINPTYKGLHDWALQKKSDTFVAKIGRVVFFSLPPQKYMQIEESLLILKRA